MVKYLVVALFVFISLAYVMSESTFNEEGAELGSGEIEDNQMMASSKVKRGIYGYGYGHRSYYPYGYYGGLSYSYYPYYYSGYGRRYGYGNGYYW